MHAPELPGPPATMFFREIGIRNQLFLQQEAHKTDAFLYALLMPPVIEHAASERPPSIPNEVEKPEKV